MSDSILFENSAMPFPGSGIRMIQVFDKPAKGILLGVMYNSDEQAIELNSADSNEIWLEAVDYAGIIWRSGSTGDEIGIATPAGLPSDTNTNPLSLYVSDLNSAPLASQPLNADNALLGDRDGVAQQVAGNWRFDEDTLAPPSDYYKVAYDRHRGEMLIWESLMDETVSPWTGEWEQANDLWTWDGVRVSSRPYEQKIWTIKLQPACSCRS